MSKEDNFCPIINIGRCLLELIYDMVVIVKNKIILQKANIIS